MHFWIDKRSQACSLSGRYHSPGVPSSRHRDRNFSWGGTGAGGCKVSSGLVMVTPVHRFQPIECAQHAGCGARRSHLQRQRLLCHQGAPLLHSHAVPHSSTSRSSAESHSLENSSGHSTLSASEGLVRGTGGMSLLPHASGPGLVSQQQVLLRLPAPHREVIVLGKIKCGLWASLALIFSFLAATKLYVDHKGSGLEVLYIVVCALLLLLLLAGCFLSLSGTGSSRGCFTSRSAQASGQAQNLRGPRSALIEVPEEEISGASDSLMLAQHTQPWIEQQNHQQSAQQSSTTQSQHQVLPHTGSGEPPPYHIAIWLPQPESSVHVISPAQSLQELPPPSYDKAIS